MGMLSKPHSDYGGSNTPKEIRDSWGTPIEVFDYFDRIYSFNLDVAANSYNHKCTQFFTIDDNSLNIDWSEHGNAVWCNPPYSGILPWMEKANQQKNKGVLSAWLIPSTPDAKWFSEALIGATTIYFIVSGRLSFIRDDTGKRQGGNTKGSCVIIFDPSDDTPLNTEYIKRDFMFEQYNDKRISDLINHTNK